ncbi:MAG: non-ribosomal peptide synthetase [Actinomycetia bacterium]|nr:non-ribosomal peptide synthetase [Actinomycetes bacterium]
MLLQVAESENTMDSNSVHERFALQARRTPDAVAVSAGDVTVTYRELDERANRLAHRLLGLGVKPEDPVMVLLERSVEMVVAIVAIVKAGALYLPLHSDYPPQRMQWIADNAGRPVLLTDEIMRVRGLPQTGPVVCVDSDEEQRALPVTDPGITVGLDNLAHVLYTSGSEGSPRGVAVTHRAVLKLALDSCWDGGGQERVLMLAPYAFGVSTYELWVPLLRGGRLVLAPPDRIDVGQLRRLITRERITAMHLTAGLFRVVASEDPACLAGVREVMTGGDVVSGKAVERVLAACPDTVVRATYGATEVAAFIVNHPMRAPYQPHDVVPLGRAMDDVRLYVLDERLAPVADDVVGDLYVAGGRLARGYFSRPGATAAAFVADPFAGGGHRMYRSGDQVRRRPDGVIEYAGRAGDQVKIRGFRVELAEVESVLAKYPGLAHAVVVARESASGDKHLVGYLVAEAGEADIEGLRAHARRLLPEYMVPTAFLAMESLPLTPNGKVDRRALPAPVLAAGDDYVPPETARQQVLCSLFAEVLKVPRVGLGDSFFDLSGESLTAMALIGSIESALGVELTVRDVFDAPTPAELDQRIDKAARPAQA